MIAASKALTSDIVPAMANSTRSSGQCVSLETVVGEMVWLMGDN
jgi:hypothetical protein